MKRIVFEGTCRELTEEHHVAAKAGDTVYFKGFHWSTGEQVPMQLCHRDNFPETTTPTYGFDDEGFFVRHIPVMCVPEWIKK